MNVLMVSVLVGLGFFLLQTNGPMHAIYMDWYASLSPKWQARFPSNFQGPAQFLIVVGWLSFILSIYFLVLRAVGRKAYSFYFQPQFYHEIANFSHTYFHERLHELVRGTLSSFFDEPKAHQV